MLELWKPFWQAEDTVDAASPLVDSDLSGTSISLCLICVGIFCWVWIGSWNNRNRATGAGLPVSPRKTPCCLLVWMPLGGPGTGCGAYLTLPICSTDTRRWTSHGFSSAPEV